MEEEVKGLSDYLDILRRHKYLVIIPAAILIIISVAVVYLLPATYKSEGLILIEAQEIPTEFVQSTVTSYAAQRIEIIKQRLLTTEKIMAVVKKYKLYPEQIKNSPPSVLVALFRENMDVTMVEANVTDPRSGRSKRVSIAFNVSFMDESPVLAQKVANELVTEFLNENVRTRTKRAIETKDFLVEEANKFQQKVQSIEKEIAEFKDENSGSLPELLQYNLSRVERLQEEIALNQNQIMVLRDQILTFSLELSNSQVYLDSASPMIAGNTPLSKTSEQLQQAKADYSRLQAKYSATHPDVLQLKRQIDSLEAELGLEANDRDTIEFELEQAQQQLNRLKQRYSDNHPDVKVATSQLNDLKLQLEQAEENTPAEQAVSKPKRQMNPIYLQLKSKIDSSEREVVRLGTRQKEIKNKLIIFEQRVVKTHQVKRAYEDMTRDHENNLAKYKELRAKQLEAELAQNLESENKGESFSLIEPPLVPNKAEKPNRPKLIAMGVIVSIGVGVGLAILVEMLFGGIRGYKEITRVIGHAPLVVIPVITTIEDIKNKKRNRNWLILLAFIIMLLSVAVFHFWVMDLEVLWFKVLRKVSLL